MSPTFIFGSASADEVMAKGTELAWTSSQDLNPCDAPQSQSITPDPGRSFIFLYFGPTVVLPSGLGVSITSVWQSIRMAYLSNGLTSAKVARIWYLKQSCSVSQSQASGNTLFTDSFEQHTRHASSVSTAHLMSNTYRIKRKSPQTTWET